MNKQSIISPHGVLGFWGFGVLGSYAMDFVLFNKPKARREKHGAERCRWPLSHNTMLVMGERDAAQWHAVRRAGEQ